MAVATAIVVQADSSGAIEFEVDRRMNVPIRVRKLRPDAVVPMYATAGAAGLDLAASCEAPILLKPLGGTGKIPTGIAIALPPGFEGQVRPRSGMARKYGVTILNAPGTIDSDYRGEIQVLLVNFGSEPLIIRCGDRIAQLVVAPVAKAVMMEVAELDETARAQGGFGSTGGFGTI